MDPVTAAINAVSAFITLQSNIFNALPPDQKTQYAVQWAERQQAWLDFWNKTIALVTPHS